MNNGVGVLLHLSEPQANNLIIFLNRVQTTGIAEARELAVLGEIIGGSVRQYQDRQAAPVAEEAVSAE